MDAEQVVRTYSDMVYGVAMRYVRNRTDADDVYSDVFYRYFRRPRTFQSEEHRRNWLLRVTVNAAKDFLQKIHYDSELTDEMIPEVSLSATSVSLEEVMDVRNAVAKLSDDQREIIELYYLVGVNTREIGQMLQKSENTVKSILLRSRKRLMELLQDK